MASPPGEYVDSSSEARTWTPASRGVAVKLYHSSERTHSAGSSAVDGCVASSTRTVASWNWSAPDGWLLKKAPPMRSDHHCQLLLSMLDDECRPATPPPSLTNCSNAARWPA